MRRLLLVLMGAGCLVAGACTTPPGGGTTNQAPVAAVTAVPSTGTVPLAVVFSSAGSHDDGTISSYSWDFGDGSVHSSSPNPSHAYTVVGIYNAKLTVTDNGGLTGSKTVVITANAAPNQPPLAVANGAPSVGKVPLAVTFSSTGSTDPDGTIASYTWDFGDGTAGSTDPAPVHSYTQAGNYAAVLTVTDNAGATNSATVPVTVNADQPPTAVANVNHLTGKEPLAVSFSSGGSTDPDGTIASYSWDFGDGSPASGDPAPSHTYFSFGTYTATLTVADDNGATDSDALTIAVVANQAPTAVANASPLSGLVPLTVQFTGSDSIDPDGTLIGYSWDFGDGNQSTLPDPSHTYGAVGNYTAALTVTDDNHVTNTAAIAIAVNAIPNVPPTAAANCSPTSGKEPVTITCSSVGSTDSDGSIISYKWDFGDGSTSTVANPSHTIAHAGSYVVSLTVTDNANGTNTATVPVTVNANQPPTAAAGGSPLTGREALTVAFTSTGSGDPDGTYAIHWDFGDGASSAQANPSHTYATHGTYTAVLTVTDDNGATDTKSVVVTVSTNQAPTSVANATPQSGASPLNVAFTGSSSVDPDARPGENLTYSWDFGDGATSASTNPSHQYAAGDYTAKLTVTDANGATGVSAPLSIHVYVDADGDGYSPNGNGPSAGTDCNDTNNAINPGAADALDTTGTDSNCDGVDGVATDSVLVSASTGSDNGSCGFAVATPCQTIAQGVTQASTTRHTVLVASGSSYGGFTLSSKSNLTIRGGYGTGFASRSGTTTSTGGVNLTSSSGITLRDLTVVGPGGTNTTAVLATSSTTVTLNGLTIQSGTASGAGSSAYGLRAVTGSTVTVQNSSISSSAGIGGTAGTTPNGALTSGTNGAGGGGGGNHSVPGGAGPGTGVNNGGNGGNGDGSAGVTGANGGGGGNGGCNNCRSNSNYSGGGAGGGLAGGNGATGTQGTLSLAAYGATWTPTVATNGGTGGNGGGGGGGGGGGRSCDSGVCAGQWTGGGSGGGGGGGGQGGGGGTAGTAAGGSFAVYSFNSTISIDANTTVSAASGGVGGAGAVGQTGGVGGSGGSGGGGHIADCCTGNPGGGGSAGAPNSNGGSGGDGSAGTCCNGASGGGGGGAGGGNGGFGGSGGGGAGGPSVGLLAKGSGAITFGGNASSQITIGTGGGGGASPNGGNAGAPGSAQKQLNVA